MKISAYEASDAVTTGLKLAEGAIRPNAEIDAFRKSPILTNMFAGAKGAARLYDVERRATIPASALKVTIERMVTGIKPFVPAPEPIL